MRPLPLLALAGLALAAACGRAPAPPAGEAPLETVDVGAAPDAGASLADEPVERRAPAPAGGIAGVLPADFPRDVPLPAPSSLVDFGPGSVTLEVQRPAAAAASAYRRQLGAAGYRERPDGSWAGAGHVLDVAVEPFHGAARITVHVAG